MEVGRRGWFGGTEGPSGRTISFQVKPPLTVPITIPAPFPLKAPPTVPPRRPPTAHACVPFCTATAV